MQPFALVGGRVVLPDHVLENGTVIVADGKIDAILDSAQVLQLPDSCTIREVHGHIVCPGFVDMHIHGGGGSDFMDGDVAAVANVCRSHLRHGTTTIFPTTTTGSPSRIHDMLAAVREYAATNELKPTIPGIHLYGPFFAADKVGCHSLEGRRSPLPEEYESYFSTGLVRIATCAAELPGAHEFYQRALDADCLITCGHSNATWSEMQAAFSQGMRHVDHFWCAMSSIPSLRARCNVPMQASMAEFVLMNQAMSTEVIADGWHLSNELLEFAYKMIGPQRLCLVTDCNRALEMPAGEYRFGNAVDGSVFVSDEKVGWAPDLKSLASSVVSMDHMVRHMFRSTTAGLAEVVRMASLTPAQLTKVDDTVGSIETGKRADLLLLDSDLEIDEVMLAGHTVPL